MLTLEFTPDRLEKCKIERDNIQAIMGAMSLQERTLCYQMIDKLQLSLANPQHGQTFMMAMAFANADMAVMLCEAGILGAAESQNVVPFEKK